jgi:hypothetical protein
MWQRVVVAGAIAATTVGCNRPADTVTSTAPPTAVAHLTTPVTATPPPQIDTFFDPVTAQALIAARAAYDAAEEAALAESERIVGKYRNVMMVSREQLTRQLAGEETRVPRSEAWRLRTAAALRIRGLGHRTQAAGRLVRI